MRRIDPKYRIEQRGYSPEGAFINDYQIVNPSGVPIPENEPLILFRARDRLALPMLRAYRALAVADGCTDFHIAGIDNRIAAFESFAIQYAERMKQPGITRGK